LERRGAYGQVCADRKSIQDLWGWRGSFHRGVSYRMPEPDENRSAGKQCTDSTRRIGPTKHASSEHNACCRQCASHDEATVPISSDNGGGAENDCTPENGSDHDSAYFCCGYWLLPLDGRWEVL
jgi:hypothetical protein